MEVPRTEADLETLAMLLSAVADLVPAHDAAGFHGQIEAALRAGGFADVRRECPITYAKTCLRGPRAGEVIKRHPGRLDLIAVRGKRLKAVALELDARSPRHKSLEKLRAFPGLRVVILRTSPSQPPPEGIDLVLGFGGSVPQTQGRRLY